MEIAAIIPHIEALIFASDKPLTAIEITEHINNAFGFMEDKLSLDQIEAAIEGVKEKYQADFYPFEIRESGGGLQFLTKKDFHKTVAQLNGDKFLKRLSPTTLETLAIIAYKQPITKGEIEAIRGVSSDYSVQRLLEKELIIIAGRNEELPGKPLVYTTSKSFMDYFGLNSVEDLPKIKEVLAEQTLPTTIFNESGLATNEVQEGDTAMQTSFLTMMETETEVAVDGLLVVSEHGELLSQSADSPDSDEPNPDDDLPVND
jgi:segregation and condensation protein B